MYETVFFASLFNTFRNTLSGLRRSLWSSARSGEKDSLVPFSLKRFATEKLSFFLSYTVFARCLATLKRLASDRFYSDLQPNTSSYCVFIGPLTPEKVLCFPFRKEIESIDKLSKLPFIVSRITKGTAVPLSLCVHSRFRLRLLLLAVPFILVYKKRKRDRNGKDDVTFFFFLLLSFTRFRN